MAVRFKTELCDSKGRVIRELQRGHNVITDWGMDQLPTINVDVLIDYLHLSSTTETLKRAGGGVTQLTIDYTTNGPGQLLITTNANFFEAGDVGRTLKILGFPEMVVDVYTSEQSIEAHARGNAWLPGFNPATPGTGPHTDFGMHYTNKATLGTQFTKFNTLDTTEANRDVELNDSANSRTIHQRIFLSTEVAGAAWTVNQLGWSDNNGSNNCFGKVNLGSPDTVPIGNKYRVTLQLYAAKTPIDLTGVSLNWGATVGTHTCDIRQERIAYDIENGARIHPQTMFNFLRPKAPTSTRAVGAFTGAFTMGAIVWQGDAGFTDLDGRGIIQATTDGLVTESVYAAGTHTITRTARWPDTTAYTAVTGIYIGEQAPGISNALYPWVTIRPQSGTITKPTGYWIELAFPLHWTRELLN